MATKKKLDHQGLLDSILTPIVAVDRDWKIMYFNPAWAEEVERDPAELEQANLLEVVPDLVNSPIYKAILEVMESGRGCTVDNVKDKRVTRERFYPIPGSGVIWLSFDVTRQKKYKETVASFVSDYHAIFNSINDGIIIYDTNTGAILEANKTAAEMFGYSRGEILRMNVADLVAGDPPYTRESVIRWVKATSEAGPQCVEWMARDKAGRLFWIELKTRRAAISGEDRMLAVVRDITERKQHLRALRESAEQYEALFDSSNDMIYLHDLDGYYMSVNRAAERITGYWREELLGMNVLDLVAEDYRDLVIGYLEFGRAIAEKKKGKNKPATYEVEIVSKYGERILLEISTWLVYKMGEPIGIQGIARDITARKAEENAMREYIFYLESIINSLPDPLLVIDTEGRVKIWNRAMEELTGVSADEMLGKGNYEYSIPLHGKRRPILVDLVAHPEDVEKYYKISEKDNYVLIGETDALGLKEEGSYLWGKAAPLFDPEGDLIGAMESIRDLTDHKKKEKALETRIKELEAEIEKLKGGSKGDHKKKQQ